ncbi:uncharacterized protein LOC121790729 isoform X2 [Salvia splendens]|uniref:uncharacterized protein LOC121790729 isoform X2 n=1 Tax=Salvia splendens TaxID=180675 RepID=UPI001C26A0C7|nr:uncharacterized protein LOC121790729 isoform X2 [Salvia splendens]
MEDLRRMRSEIQRPAANISVSDDRFTDVFGGAPRSIFSHHLSAAGCFYDDIFWPTEKPAEAAAQPVRRSGRNLPLFDIPSLQQVSIDRSSRQRSGFFSDIFGWDTTKMMSWRSRSKTNSSSVLSSEELSPVRFPVCDDISLLASKLRPINIKTKWDSHHKKQPVFSNMDCENEFLEKLWGSKEIEENLDIEQMKFRVTENDDIQFNSPSSAISNAESCEIIDEEMEMEIDEDELMSSYVIELDSCSRDTAYESTDVDEAIAWAKDRIRKYSSQEKPITQEVMDESHISSNRVEDSSLLEDDTSILDEKIRLWLTGKESDIRLLLSSLHHILLPNSGWIAIPLMKLMESSQVKKAYQKSILCLHPDKLQQRGASLLHKYIAEKAFVALQDAWTTFITLDVSCR